jgi:glutaredoxin
MKLKVFTLPSCKKCPAAKKIVKDVADKDNLDFLEVAISTPDGQLEGLMHQIMNTPSIAIDERGVSRGALISREDLDAEVRKRLDNETS